MKVLGNDEDNLRKVCKNEKIYVEKVFYFVALLFWVFGLVDNSCFALESSQMRYLNLCGETQNFKTF